MLEKIYTPFSTVSRRKTGEDASEDARRVSISRWRVLNELSEASTETVCVCPSENWFANDFISRGEMSIQSIEMASVIGQPREER